MHPYDADLSVMQVMLKMIVDVEVIDLLLQLLCCFAVLVAKLIHASSAGVGFATSHDCQKILAFIRRSKRARRAGFCTSDLDDFEILCTTADIQLFARTLNSPQHAL